MPAQRPRPLNLLHGPTPLEELPRLRAALGCSPRIWVKRDDLTPLGLGGNKVRKLQYEAAAAVARGADVLVTTAGVQSNHCRLTAALARKLGMDCVLLIQGEPPAFRQGNQLLYLVFGADIRFLGPGTSLDETLRQVCTELEGKGRRPYFVPIGASTSLGALGYVDAVAEVEQQAKELGVRFDHAFVGTGSCGTQAGLLAGVAAHGSSMEIHGISVGPILPGQPGLIRRLADGALQLMGLPGLPGNKPIRFYEGYYGEDYGKPTPEALEAIRLLARTEGLVLDPVYTGKAMAGMLDLIQRGRFDHAPAVLFFHTGGAPGLFARAALFQPQ